jgi:hypothetical protein
MHVPSFFTSWNFGRAGSVLNFGRPGVLADYQRRVFRKRYIVDMPVCNGILPRNNWKKQPAGQDTFPNRAPKELISIPIGERKPNRTAARTEMTLWLCSAGHISSYYYMARRVANVLDPHDDNDDNDNDNDDDDDDACGDNIIEQ